MRNKTELGFGQTTVTLNHFVVCCSVASTSGLDQVLINLTPERGQYEPVTFPGILPLKSRSIATYVLVDTLGFYSSFVLTQPHSCQEM
jgi:TATA-box binding protein (TBP) (component of TFIID and TFIIIB)